VAAIASKAAGVTAMHSYRFAAFHTPIAPHRFVEAPRRLHMLSNEEPLIAAELGQQNGTQNQ
jgi:hypothetical protein